MKPHSRILAVITIVAGAFASTASTRAETIEPFNGRSLANWLTKEPISKNQWVVGIPEMTEAEPTTLAVGAGHGAMINPVRAHRESVDIYTAQTFGDCKIELEFMVAKGANSGVYVHGEYEIQVLDSYGKEKLGSGDVGAIYGATPPPVNASKAPGTWQTYEIHFRAPQFNAAGEKTANAVFEKVALNGVTLHENVVMAGPTPSGVTGTERPKGPIMFQGDHGPVAYRNIRITPLD